MASKKNQKGSGSVARLVSRELSAVQQISESVKLLTTRIPVVDPLRDLRASTAGILGARGLMGSERLLRHIQEDQKRKDEFARQVSSAWKKTTAKFDYMRQELDNQAKAASAFYRQFTARNKALLPSAAYVPQMNTLVEVAKLSEAHSRRMKEIEAALLPSADVVRRLEEIGATLKPSMRFGLNRELIESLVRPGPVLYARGLEGSVQETSPESTSRVVVPFYHQKGYGLQHNRPVFQVSSVSFDSVNGHIDKALRFMRSGEVRSSICESVHAVESAVRTLTRAGDIEKGLRQLEQRGYFKSSRYIRKMYSQFFGWGSDTVRHCELPWKQCRFERLDAEYAYHTAVAYVNDLVIVAGGGRIDVDDA